MKTTVDLTRPVFAIHHRGDAQGRRCTSFVNGDDGAGAIAEATRLGLTPIEYVAQTDPLDGRRCEPRIGPDGQPLDLESEPKPS